MEKSTDPKQHLKGLLRQATHAVDPSKAVHSELTSQTDLLEKLNEKQFPTKMEVSIKGIEVLTLKGDQGEKGETGPEPSDTRLIKLIKPLIPEPITGPAGKDSTVPGPAGKDGKSIVGPEGPAGKDGISIKGDPGKDGKDGKDATPEAIVEVLKKTKALDISHIRNSEGLISAAGKINKIDFDDQRWHGGGLSMSHFISGEVVPGSGTSWALKKPARLLLFISAQGQVLSSARGDFTFTGNQNFTTGNSWNSGDIEATYYW